MGEMSEERLRAMELTHKDLRDKIGELEQKLEKEAEIWGMISNSNQDNIRKIEAGMKESFVEIVHYFQSEFPEDEIDDAIDDMCKNILEIQKQLEGEPQETITYYEDAEGNQKGYAMRKEEQEAEQMTDYFYEQNLIAEFLEDYENVIELGLDKLYIHYRDDLLVSKDFINTLKIFRKKIKEKWEERKGGD